MGEDKQVNCPQGLNNSKREALARTFKNSRISKNCQSRFSQEGNGVWANNKILARQNRGFITLLSSTMIIFQCQMMKITHSTRKMSFV